MNARRRAWWMACGMSVIFAALLAACAPARPRVGHDASRDLVVRASDVTAPGPRSRLLTTLVTTGSGDRRVDEERVYSPVDNASGAWTAITRERALGDDDAWSNVQTSRLSRAPDGSVWLHAITNHASGKVATLSRRGESSSSGGPAPGLVIVPPILRLGDVHEDVCAARTTDLASDAPTRGGLTGSARVRTWLEPDADVPSGSIVHMHITISAGPAVVQRQTSMRLRRDNDAWTLSSEVATLTVRVGPIIIEDVTRDAEVAMPDQLSGQRR